MTLLEISVAIIVIFGGLWFDLSRHKDNHTVGIKEAALWSAFWVGLSFAFAGFVWFSRGSEASILFITGYFLEKALAVDNLFVIEAIFISFGLAAFQFSGIRHKILYYGIIGAIVMRIIFIGLGSYMAGLSDWVLFGFALIILYTVYIMWMTNSEDDVDYVNHWAVKFFERFWPVTYNIESEKFFVKQFEKSRISGFDKGLKPVWHLTPLFLCLIVIEISDIIFAFDSVPTIIAVVNDFYIAFTASIMAVMGLRSLYFLLSAAKDLLCHLEAAVMIVLVFIAGKIMLSVTGIIHLSPLISLGIVGVILSLGIISSYIWPEEVE